MPSDDPVATPEVGGRGLAYWLRSQELGLACGLATVALLAVGSVVLPATADGASKGIALDDVRPFFDRPSSTHAWFYGLVAVLAAYALNTALATWHSVTRRWRAGVRAPTAYAPALFHLAFLVALLAHAVGGFYGREDGRFVVGPDLVSLPDGRRVRTLSLAIDALPSGMPKTVQAELEITTPAGAATRVTVGYNDPASTGLGSDLLILQDQALLPMGGGPPKPVVVLRERHSPGNPLALLAAVLMAAGVALLGRRLV